MKFRWVSACTGVLVCVFERERARETELQAD